MAEEGPRTLREILDESGERFAKRPALLWSDGSGYTFHEVSHRALCAAIHLTGHGVKRGDRVAILSESRPEWGIAYFGLAAAGFVAVPILPDFAPAQISAIVAHAECSVIIVSSRLAAKLEPEIPAARVVIDLEELIKPPDQDSGADDLEADPIPVLWEAFPAPRPADLASIIYTSGTTGKPKGVMLSHLALAHDAWASRSAARIYPRDRFLSILPQAHAYEFTIGFLAPFLYGASVHYLDKPPSPSVLIPALAAVRPTMMLSVPLVIEKIVRSQVFPKIAAMRLPKPAGLRRLFLSLIKRIAGARLKKTFGGKLRFFGVGGAALAADVEDFLRAAGFPYASGYGMTEAAPLISGIGPARNKLYCVGPPVTGVKVRIAPPLGKDGEGEIQVKGPILMDGYYREPELTKAAFTEDHWLKTGDLGTLDRQGFLRIRGRIKTMILGPSGENIYPEEIEALINGFDFVEESLVYGDEEHGVTALIHLKPEVAEGILKGAAEAVDKLGEGVASIENAASHLIESLRKGVNARLAAFSRVKRFVLKQEPFEKTPSKKIKREAYLKAKKP
jgi:long-chain acyl-CoA synthetase